MQKAWLLPSEFNRPLDWYFGLTFLSNWIETEEFPYLASHCGLDLFDDPSLTREWKLSLPPVPVTQCSFTCLGLVWSLLLFCEVTTSLSQFSKTCSFLSLFCEIGENDFLKHPKWEAHDSPSCVVLSRVSPLIILLWSCSAPLATLLKYSAYKLPQPGPAMKSWYTEDTPVSWALDLSCCHLRWHCSFRQLPRRSHWMCRTLRFLRFWLLHFLN